MSKINQILHNLELLFKRAANKFIQNNYSPELISEPVNLFKNDKNFKILLLRHDRIGDVLISTPYLKELRSLMPDTRIDILFSFKNKAVSSAVEKYVNKIFVLNNKASDFIKLIKLIRSEQYDLIIDLLDNESATSNLILKYSAAKTKLGFDKSNANNYNYVVPLPDKGQVHIAKRLFSLLLPFGYYKIPETIKIDYPLDDDKKQRAAELLGPKRKDIRLGINLTGSNESKYWGNDNYINFILDISKKYEVETILFAVPKIKAAAEKIAESANAKLAPIQNDFMIYAAMLQECDIILTPDTAAVHIAAAFDKPVIALFNSPNPEVLMPWYPLNKSSKSIVAKFSIAEITVGQVVSAFDEIMKERMK